MTTHWNAYCKQNNEKKDFIDNLHIDISLESEDKENSKKNPSEICNSRSPNLKSEVRVSLVAGTMQFSIYRKIDRYLEKISISKIQYIEI